MRARSIARRTLAVACALSALAPAVASAADPGRWTIVGRSTIPLVYFQGMTSAPNGNLFFDGINTGLYRSDSQLVEEGRVANVIPQPVAEAEDYNHIGDITYDAADGGRILLPLECYYPGTQPSANTCGTGSIGVADPATLGWEYYVKLDDGAIKKAMWAEASPDGTELWTEGPNDDLLVYDMADISAANAAPAGPAITPSAVYPNAVPDDTATGATFFRGRLYVAGSVHQPGPTDLFQVWSLDPHAGGTAAIIASRRLEIEREIAGESEGLDVFGSLGGVLHWQVQPIPSDLVNQKPTFDPRNGSLLSFVPSAGAPDIHDADDDGVVDAVDGCDAVAGGDDPAGCPLGPPPPADADRDGIPVGTDACPDVADNFQADADQDGTGDACDPDDDGDLRIDAADNCRFRANPGQLDTDGDGSGDACEDDDDNDGVVDYRDNCPVDANVDQADADRDGTGDACEETSDVTSPRTRIRKARFDDRERRATFRFTSNEAGSSFRCVLDGRRRRKCDSPRVFEHLSRGRHTFSVRAVDAAGNVDATAAKKRFRIERSKR